ncbi:GGDEF domain-containing protein [Microvirga thermotolerans]|nr:GGDEF domain-containing protein [Microvirga thermotolerans]
MKLDLQTLSAIFAELTAVLGALLLFSWTLNRKVQALAWWGAAYLLVLTALGIVLLAGGKASINALLLGNCFLALAYGVLYGGCCVFNGRVATVQAVTAGVVLWCLASLLILDDANMRVIVVSAICAAYSGFSAWELARRARHPLASRAVAVGLLCCLVVFNIFRGTVGFSLALAFWMALPDERWSGPMAFAMATFMPTLAFVFLSMAKEQLEWEYKQAALVDSLTGIPNRRAFFEKASALVAQRTAVSCLLFDLDNFKAINDRFGHEAGDHVLVIFARILAEHLPRGVFARLGGEEFAAMVPLGGADAEALANGIRRAFSSVDKIAQGARIDVTVSAGCATGTDATVERLLREADSALYRAKAEGRNAVASFRSAEG